MELKALGKKARRDVEFFIKLRQDIFRETEDLYIPRLVEEPTRRNYYVKLSPSVDSALREARTHYDSIIGDYATRIMSSKESVQKEWEKEFITEINRQYTQQCEDTARMVNDHKAKMKAGKKRKREADVERRANDLCEQRLQSRNRSDSVDSNASTVVVNPEERKLLPDCVCGKCFEDEEE